MISGRATLQVPAVIATVLGFLLIFVGLATPAWQVTYARELRQWVQSGLWLNCQTRPTGMYTCTYTFSQNDFDFYTSAEVVNIRTPAFYRLSLNNCVITVAEWQRTLLHIYLVGQFAAFLALVFFCVSHSKGAEKCALLFFNSCIGIAALTTIGCACAFAIFSQMVEYRFYHVSVSGIYEKHRGYSYYLALIGALFYIAAAVLSVMFTIQHLRKRDENPMAFSVYREPPYRVPSDMYRLPNEDFYAMRELPPIPQKYR